MSECIFCAIVAGRAPASLVYQDEFTTAFMDIQPVNPGHLLVVPNRHAGNLAELPPEAGPRLFTVAQRLAAALRQSGLQCEGINLWLADGRAAGQDVFHVHLHVLPRFLGDGFGLVFPPTYHQRPPRAQLEAIAEKIRSRFQSTETPAGK